MTDEVRNVQWLQVPPRLYVEHVDHLRDLAHELKIIHAGAGVGAAVAREVATLLDGVLEQWNASRTSAEDQARRALDAGDERVDITVEVPADGVDSSGRILDLLEKADELCRAEQLLTLEAPEEVAFFRRWSVQQVAAQAGEGRPPEPYPGLNGS